ncbi:MAG: UvrD-helicase domain-containing protein, partial [Pirellulaceae bacterium]
PKVATRTALELNRPDTTAHRFAELLTDLVHHLNTLQVETLDAFFARIARSFSLDIGMPPDWQIAEESEVNSLRNRAIRRSLTRRATINIVHDLAKGEAKRGISYLVRQTVGDLYDIYRETVDEQRGDAWNQLNKMPLLEEAEIDFLIAEVSSLDIDGTAAFHRTLTEDLERAAKRDWHNFRKKGISGSVAKNNTSFRRRELPPELLGPLRKLTRHAVALNINLLVDQTRGAHQFLKTYHREFWQLKADNSVLEFDDVAWLAWRLFSGQPWGKLAWRLDQNIDHLLLDEFQDTSIRQWQVLKPLAKRVCSHAPNRSFLCVGDIKQAIYGWRGGVAEIFDEVRGELQDNLDDVASQNVSYRSSAIVIEAVNNIFLNMQRHGKLEDQKPAFQSWWDKFEPHTTAKNELPGFVTFENTSRDDLHSSESALRIKQLAEQHPGHSVGVLCRTNDAVAEMIFELGLLGVAASEEGGNPLTDSAAVNILLAALRLIDHPGDTLSRFHLLHTPLADVFEITSDNVVEAGHPCRRVSQNMRLRLLDAGYGELLSNWARLLEPICTAREWFRAGQLIEKGYRISAADHLRTADFIASVEHERVGDPSAAQINVMTIHRAKGMEFDIVVLPELDFDRGQPPSYIVGRDSPTKPIKLICRYMEETQQEWLPDEFQAAFVKNEEGQIHELLSTIYVAVTRAKFALHMIAGPKMHKDRKSASGLIMAALDIDYHKDKESPGRILWASGQEDWQSRIPGDGRTQPVTARKNGRAPLGPIQLAPVSTHRNLPWESPSSREGGDYVTLGRLLQLEDNRDARLAGSLVHACFEQIKWLDESVPPDDELRDYLADVDQAGPVRIKQAISEFRKVLRRPHTSALLNRNHYQNDLFQSFEEFEVQNERPFAVRMGGGVVSGYIDRLVLLKRDGKIVAADVIDFKTDALPAGDHEALQKRVEIYRPQILSYRDAVAAIYKLSSDNVSASLLFVASDKHVTIA